MNFDLDTALGRIGYLAGLRNARRYLEIGVRLGDTFFNVDLPFKVGVDPDFGFDPSAHEKPGVHFFSLPSNIFFRKLRTGALNIGTLLPVNEGEEKPAFDLIFIDGLHTFEQSYRDFESSLAFAHDNTLWILDDTVPCDEISAIPDMEQSFRMRRACGDNSEPWHGDVYKTVFAIHDEHPEYSYCTLMGGNAQTIVWKAERSARTPKFSSREVIAQLSFRNMLALSPVLMPVENEDFPGLVGKSLDTYALVDQTENALTRRLAFLQR